LSRKTVSLLGCGAIGANLAHAIDNGDAGNTSIGAIFDGIRSKAVVLSDGLKTKPFVAHDMDSLLGLDADLVVESASQDAIRSFGIRIVESGKDLMVMSVGALLDDVLRDRLYQSAVAKKRKIIIPTGAIAGIDALKACSGKISAVKLVTRKRPNALAGAPFFEINKIDLNSITKETVLFEGPAVDAVRLFPSNVNVAAILSLAGIGKEQTKVVVIADPETKTNSHKITVTGDFGEFIVQMNNIPHPQNQGTSYLAVLSAIEAIRTYGSEDRVG